MKRMTVLLVFLLAASVMAGGVDFDRFFENKTLRVDFFITGNAHEEDITLDQIKIEGEWAGNPRHLVDDFIKGAYFIKAYDVASNALIYSRGFDCIYSEYVTTTQAIEGAKRTYHHSALLPLPKRPIRFVLEKGDKQNIYRVAWVRTIDPADYHFLCEGPPQGTVIYEAHTSGDPHNCVDLVWVGDGYSTKETRQFKKDCDRYVEVLFSVEPFKSYRHKFNITGVLLPSAESGVDEPRKGRYVKTAVSSSFNAFDIPRYLLTEDNKAYRDIAGAVPYDAIVILVNDERYGGGGIYNFYGLTTVNHELSENVFLHEFGHSFSGLADEYYSSATAYNEFYPQGAEPAELNITRLMDPDNVKWKALISPSTPVPTPWGKQEVEALEAEMASINKTLKTGKLSTEEEKVSRKRFDEARASRNRIREVNVEKWRGKVGVFEGAGYSSEGIYRPEIHCMMYSNARKEFCAVCRAATERMIKFYID
ncbi:hypothetical protein KAR48_18770 [bacterium]|nr:hypothetical protein [bacterium]